MLKAPGNEQALKLEYDKLLSSFARHFNSRRYNEGIPLLWAAAAGQVGGMQLGVGLELATLLVEQGAKAGAHTRPLFGST
jgi:hypothetical protein